MALVATMGLYPLANRVTNFPQVMLGVSFGIGQFAGAASMGMDVLKLMQVEVIGAIGCLYASNIGNRVIYDAIYLHQD